MAKVVAVRVFTNLDVFTVIWYFPTRLKLVVLSHEHHPRTASITCGAGVYASQWDAEHVARFGGTRLL